MQSITWVPFKHYNRTLLPIIIYSLIFLACDHNSSRTEKVIESDEGITAGETSDAGESVTAGNTDEAGDTVVAGDPMMIAQTPRVELSLGSIEGMIEENSYGSTIAFKGIPYATPPIGELRFKPPQVAMPWNETLLAHHFGATCPQDSLLTDEGSSQSEDCLSLNIWAPTDESGKTLSSTPSKPVMVWVHGGGFVQGAGSFNLYDGARLSARGDVIIVTVNYRLGLLGFLNTRRLADDDFNGVHSDDEDLTHARQVANFGIQDQLLALQWVQEHIGHFGGDPNNVTVFGESAGGFSICALLSSPLSEALFQQVIIQSGGGCNGFEPLGEKGVELADTPAEQSATAALDAMGCSELSGRDLHTCLTNVPLELIISNASAGGESVLGLPQLGPVTDGTLIKGRADHLIRDGLLTPPRLLIGSNADEMTLFTFNIPIDLDFYQGVIEGFFGLLANRIFDLYPATSDQEARAAYNALLSDLIFICPTLTLASAISDYGPTDHEVWVYHFTHSISSGLPALLGSTHALEIPFVFNNTHIELYGATASEEDQQLSLQMSDAWLNFARTGDPSTPDLSWPSYRASESASIDEGQVMEWGVPPTLLNDPIREGRCQSLNELDLLRGIE